MMGLDMFEFSEFMHPWLLLLIIAAAALLAIEWFARAPGVVRVSTGEAFAASATSRSLLVRLAPALLRFLALTFLIVALARPVKGMTPVQDRADIIDIMLCVDVSGSMRMLDFVDPQGVRRDRLYVTKAAVRDFIASRKAKPSDRFGLDRLGLILYAGYAWTQCPLTLDYGILEHELDRAQIDDNDARKQGTAIGSALGLAVARLRDSEAKSKIIILLTDGRNNTGELEPITAADIARKYDIKVYSIGAGSDEGGAIPQQTIFGTQLISVNQPIDEETLRQIASTTGGRYYRATDTASLEQAYDEINQLETTEVELGEYYDYEEGFLPYCLTGAALMALALFGKRLWFDPIP